MRLIKLTQVRENGMGEASELPTYVNPEYIRCFYPRVTGGEGTRLTFADGGGFAVSEPLDVVSAMIEGGRPPARPRRRATAEVETAANTNQETGEDDGLTEAH